MRVSAPSLRRLSIVALAAALPACSQPAAADAPFPPRLSLLVGFGPAQGNDQPARPEAATLSLNRFTPDMSYDQTARFLARHLGRFLPGAPTVEARLAPGGAGLVAARRLANSKPDGNLIALLSANVIFGSALRLPGADVKATDFVWLGGVAPDAWACIRTSASTGKKRAWTGSLGIGSRADVHARAMRDLADYPMEIATGYTSRFELVRALENGELDAACGWPLADLNRRQADWLLTGKIFLIGEFSRSRKGPTAPGWSPEGAVAEAFNALAAEPEIAWPLAAPPGTNRQIAAALSEALDAISYDRTAIEDARYAGIELDPIDASTIDKHVRRLHNLKPEVQAILARIYSGK